MTEKRFEYKNHKVFDNLTGEEHSSNMVSVNVLNQLARVNREGVKKVQKLAKENEQLKSENMLLTGANKILKENNERLKEENQKLMKAVSESSRMAVETLLPTDEDNLTLNGNWW